MILKEIVDSLNVINSDSIKTMLEDETVKETLIATYNYHPYDLAEWKAYKSNNLLKKIITKLHSQVEPIWTGIDYIAALGGSGSPLAVGLSLYYDKNFIFINDRWGITKKFQPIKPPLPDEDIKGKKVLLVDSVLRTGLTAYNGFKIIKDHGGLPIIMVIALLPEWIDQSILKELKDVDFYYMFHWNGDVENKALEMGLISKNP
ncbi:Phosphoribosyl transferase domain protein [uncultured archaeon]|nr:Phosphoribosyl transferase domain protein [uncultured archaeon]